MKKIMAIPVTLSLMVFCFGTGWAVAQTRPSGEEAIVRELFTVVSPDALSAQPIQDRPDREVVRWRFVRVNLDHLTELESIALNFFDDVTITAARERVEHRSEGRYTWFGEVSGKEFSDVVLTIENGDLVGGVRIDGKLYRVEPLWDGLHIVRQLDPSAFPRESSADVRIPDRDFGTAPLGQLQESAFTPDDGSTIDIMVVYTDDAASSSIGTQIQYAIDLTNRTYEKSFINQRLRLVHTAQVNYAESKSSDTNLNYVTTNPEITAWRDKYRADIVSLWVEGIMDCKDWDLLCLFGGTTGIAWLWGAHNVVMRKYASDDFVLAHESGHNMGAGHDIHAPQNDGIFPYSHGYVWTGWTGLLWYCRTTVMAYPDYCYNNGYWLTHERIGRWSNPDIDWRVCEAAGWPCTNWTRLGIPGSTENARTLNETAYTVANFRQSNRVPISDAGGPYLAECQGSSTMLTLDGTGSSDPDGDALTYFWTTNCPGGSFSDSTAAKPTLTVNTSAVCNLWCTVSLIVTDTSGLSSVSDSVTVTIQEAPHRDEIIGTGGSWSSGIWSYNLRTNTWSKPYSFTPSGPIAAGDVNGDGRADIVSCWLSGLWYQNGATLGWTKVYTTAPSKVAVGDITGDGYTEIIGTWSSGIWYWNPVNSGWTKMYGSIPSGPIAAGDVTGDESADVASIWPSGLWYQDGATLGWTKVYSNAPSQVAVGDITGGWRAEIIGMWSNGIWYWDPKNSCKQHADCSQLEYCQLSIGCSCLGQCTFKPGVCIPDYAPVCGCDGKTYDNACWAAASSVSISYNGPCVSNSNVSGCIELGTSFGWTKMCSSVPSGPIAVGDVTGDGRADVVSCWPSGLWYQDGATLGWTKVYSTAPSKLAIGDITGD
jgi:hypothetical protein